MINKEINKAIRKTKARANFLHIQEYAEQMKLWWIDKSVVDKELLKKDKEIIELYLDRAKTWLVIKAWWMIWFTILLINTWWDILLSSIFIISLIFSITWTVFANKNYNIHFNTLLRKLENKDK